jgi:hypothetical protein
LKYTKPPIPFKRLKVIPGRSIVLKTLGKFLVIPTGDPDILPEYNEYTLDSNRLPLEIGTYTLTDELKNLKTFWIVIYDPTETGIDFFLFTHKPKKLEYVVSNVEIPTGQFQTADGINFITADGMKYYVNLASQFQTADGANFVTADGVNYVIKNTDNYITSLILYPGNGTIYHGQITHSNPSLDSDSDLVPDIFGKAPYHFVTQDGNYFTTADNAYFDVLSIADGSITKLLEAYGMVI